MGRSPVIKNPCLNDPDTEYKKSFCKNIKKQGKRVCEKCPYMKGCSDLARHLEKNNEKE